ncbi:STAS domain-containing protein [Thalassomonas viridans]|uniref:STAS domain-containing protein n=1 Tax=Thalassomonas viridans TaxID=137584 RepID=A0AAE9Z379_9GAMM|nr:STAS domain-containing protein [Thalassomonas viridans]WDE04403.1 STAS domain-containing protein [Thalassomonas viridans]
MSQIEFALSAQGGTLSGEFTRHTVPTLAANTIKKLLKNDNAVLDLKAVSGVDTAGLAWLLALVEQAEKARKEVTLKHLPEDLLKLAKLSGVDHFLPIREC